MAKYKYSYFPPYGNRHLLHLFPPNLDLLIGYLFSNNLIDASYPHIVSHIIMAHSHLYHFHRISLALTSFPLWQSHRTAETHLAQEISPSSQLRELERAPLPCNAKTQNLHYRTMISYPPSLPLLRLNRRYYLTSNQLFVKLYWQRLILGSLPRTPPPFNQHRLLIWYLVKPYGRSPSGPHPFPLFKTVAILIVPVNTPALKRSRNIKKKCDKAPNVSSKPPSGSGSKDPNNNNHKKILIPKAEMEKLLKE